MNRFTSTLSIVFAASLFIAASTSPVFARHGRHGHLGSGLSEEAAAPEIDGAAAASTLALVAGGLAVLCGRRRGR